MDSRGSAKVFLFCILFFDTENILYLVNFFQFVR